MLAVLKTSGPVLGAMHYWMDANSLCLYCTSWGWINTSSSGEIANTYVESLQKECSCKHEDAYEARNFCVTSDFLLKVSLYVYKYARVYIFICVVFVCVYVFLCVFIYVAEIWNSTQLRSTGASEHSALFLPGHPGISYTSLSVLLPCLAPEHTSCTANSSALDYAVETG